MNDYREYLEDDLAAAAGSEPFIPGFVASRLTLKRWLEDFHEAIELRKMPFLKAFYEEKLAEIDEGKALGCFKKAPEVFGETPLEFYWRQWALLQTLFDINFPLRKLPIRPKELEPFEERFIRLQDNYSLHNVRDLSVSYYKIQRDVADADSMGYSKRLAPMDDLLVEERASRMLVDDFMERLFAEILRLAKQRFSVGRDRNIRILLGEIARYKGLIKHALYFYNVDGVITALLDSLPNPSHIIVKFVKSSLISIIEEDEFPDISKNNMIKLIELYKEEILDTEDIVQTKDKTALLIAEVIAYLRDPI